MHAHPDQAAAPEPEPGAEPLTPTGVPLDAPMRARLEHTLGAPLDDVRVHRGPMANELARHEAAHGIAQGRDVVLPQRVFAHGPLFAEAILAHEAAHVVQQRQRGAAASTAQTEAAANAAALAHLSGRRAPPQPAAARGLQFAMCGMGEPMIDEGDPADYAVDVDLIDRIEAPPDVERAYEAYAAVPRGSGSGYSIMPEGQRYNDTLSAAGLGFADRDLDRHAFPGQFETYAAQWALKMLADSEALSPKSRNGTRRPPPT